MIYKIAQKELLLQQAHALRRKNYRPGFDGMTAHHAIIWLEINGDQLCRRLLRGSYDPMPATSFRRAKSDGTYRRLIKLSALDMILQGAMIQELSTVLETRFSENSHAYRSGKGVTTAIQQYCSLGSQYPFAAKVDPKACFDHIDHTVLENQLAAVFADPLLIDLIMKYVRIPIMIDGEATVLPQGIPQGAPLSNLLCNLYLSALDDYLHANDIPFVRYADDIVIFSSTHTDISGYFAQTIRFLKEELHLDPNTKKCRIESPANLRYLGYRFENSHYGLTAFDANTSSTNAYRQWYVTKPTNNHRRLDVLSDGILRQKDFGAVFDDGEQETGFPVLSTDTINLYSSVVFDTNFLKRAMDNGISIHIFDEYDRLVGRFIPNSIMHSPSVPHNQLLQYYDEKKRLALAKRFVQSSLHNCRLNIRYYNKQNNHTHYNTALEKINQLNTEVKKCDTYEKLLLTEARIREHYYSCFDLFLAGSGYSFDHRTRQPPLNEVNALLSFGNTILYSIIATEINKSPLDIRIGYLHATNRRAESLNLDIADVYKSLLVDRIVFSMINLNMLREEDFIQANNGGIYLSQTGKRKFLRAFYDKLDTSLTIRDQKMTYMQIIRQDIQALTRYFRHNEPYVPFKQVK